MSHLDIALEQDWKDITSALSSMSNEHIHLYHMEVVKRIWYFERSFSDRIVFPEYPNLGFLHTHNRDEMINLFNFSEHFQHRISHAAKGIILLTRGTVFGVFYGSDFIKKLGVDGIRADHLKYYTFIFFLFYIFNVKKTTTDQQLMEYANNKLTDLNAILQRDKLYNHLLTFEKLTDILVAVGNTSDNTHQLFVDITYGNYKHDYGTSIRSARAILSRVVPDFRKSYQHATSNNFAWSNTPPPQQQATSTAPTTSAPTTTKVNTTMHTPTTARASERPQTIKPRPSLETYDLSEEDLERIQDEVVLAQIDALSGVREEAIDIYDPIPEFRTALADGLQMFREKFAGVIFALLGARGYRTNDFLEAVFDAEVTFAFQKRDSKYSNADITKLYDIKEAKIKDFEQIYGEEYSGYRRSFWQDSRFDAYTNYLRKEIPGVIGTVDSSPPYVDSGQPPEIEAKVRAAYERRRKREDDAVQALLPYQAEIPEFISSLRALWESSDYLMVKAMLYPFYMMSAAAAWIFDVAGVLFFAAAGVAYVSMEGAGEYLLGESITFAKNVIYGIESAIWIFTLSILIYGGRVYYLRQEMLGDSSSNGSNKRQRIS